MTSLDRLLQGLSPTGMATAFYLVLSKDRRSFEGVSAGHPPPIMSCGPDGTCTYIMFDPHPPLGVLEQPRYRALTVDVASGSLLLLYTDGLVEERNASLDDGLKRLADIIDPRQLSLEQVCSDVLSTMVPGEKSDDIALLAVRVTHD